MPRWTESRRVLFVVEADTEYESLLRRTIALAKRNNASVRVAHCLQPPSKFGAGAYAHEMHHFLVREWQRELEGLIAPHRSEGLSIEPVVLTGDPGTEIARLVVQDDIQIVIKTSSDVEGAGRLSSLDIDLVRNCPCSTWLGRHLVGDKYKQILVPVDCMNEAHKEINQQMLTSTASFADLEGATLHVCHAWTMYGEAALYGRAFIKTSAGQVKTMIDEERRMHEDAFDQLLRSVSASNVEKHVVKGPPAKVIPQLVEQHEIDLLVMGAGARPGIAGWLLGSTAEQLLGLVPCSVCAVKPHSIRAGLSVD